MTHSNPKKYNKEEVLELLQSTPPDVLFSEEFQIKNLNLRQGFSDFFKQNYKQVEKINEVTYSTNHVSYHLFKNENNNDIRILKAESGCFSSNEKFVSLSDIEIYVQKLEEQKNSFLSESPEIDKPGITEWFDTRINSVAKVLTKYEELKNNKTPKMKM